MIWGARVQVRLCPNLRIYRNLGNENEFAKSKTITATIEALRAADRADMLQGHGCIGSIQSLLVELLNYVEGKEGLSHLFTTNWMSEAQW